MAEGEGILTVKHGGKSVEVEVPETLGALKDRLHALFAVPSAHQKLIYRGKALGGGTASGEDVLLSDLGIDKQQRSKLLLVGSTQEDVEALEAGREAALAKMAADRTRPLVMDNEAGPGGAGGVPKGYKKIPLGAGRGGGGSKYRFGRIETLPGLPEEDKARAILEGLANDPGILAVLELHKWSVGALCELPPEGKVGVSERCIMGLNENFGQRILLRLRTDDMQGFRKALSIKKVLYHELAHNEVGPHNDAFYILMRQVEREANASDWTQSRGKSVSASRAVYRDEERMANGPYVLVKEAFEGGSGRLGGESSGLTALVPARDLAATAAMGRLSAEEMEVEEGCGCSSGRLRGGGASVMEQEEEEEKGHEEEQEEGGVVLAGEESMALEQPEPPQQASDQSRIGGSNPLTGAEEVRREDEAEGMDAMMAEASLGVLPSLPSQSLQAPPAAPSPPPVASGVSEEKQQLGIVHQQEREREEEEEKERKREEEEEEEERRKKKEEDEERAAALSQLLAMGFDRPAAEAALVRCSGRAEEAIEWLLTGGGGGVGGEEGTEAVAPGAPGGGGLSPPAHTPSPMDVDASPPAVAIPPTAVAAVPSSPEERVRMAAAALACDAEASRARLALDTLSSMMGAILAEPKEQRFRRVRLQNKRVVSALGFRPEGFETLRAAGFQERGGEMVLTRNDLGLLWLAKSIVDSHRTWAAS